MKLFFLVLLATLFSELSSQTLAANPNPFVKRTLITYNLVNADTVTLLVYSSLGSVVATVHSNTPMQAGNYSDSLSMDNHSDGVYFVFLKSKKGCQQTIKILKTYQTAIEELLFDSELNVNPNPANEVLNIQSSLRGEINIRIYSVSGQLRYEASLRKFSGKHPIDVSDWEREIYFVEMRNETGSAKRKIILK